MAHCVSRRRYTIYAYVYIGIFVCKRRVWMGVSVCAQLLYSAREPF